MLIYNEESVSINYLNRPSAYVAIINGFLDELLKCGLGDSIGHK